MLQCTETFYIIVQFTVFTRHDTTTTASDMNMLQVLLTGRKESSIIGSIFLHMPEVTHTLYTCTFRITADSSRIRYKTEVECFFTIQWLKDDSSIMLQCIFTQLMHLFAQEITSFQCMRHTRTLPIESRYHDDTSRTQFTGCSYDVTHSRIKFSLHLRIFCQDKSVKTGTNGRNLDISTRKGLLELIHSTSQVTSTRLKAYNTEAFHIVQLLIQTFTRCSTFLERQTKFGGRNHYLLFR